MRVIAGSRRGFRLSGSKDSRIRPTTDSAREFVFNVLGDAFVNSLVLDVFAGTGSLGIEALSRGAARAVFVEKSRPAQSLIRDNLKKTGFSGSAELLTMPARRGLRLLAARPLSFKIILMDPPYATNLASEALEQVSELELLAAGGVMVVEHGFRDAELTTGTRYSLASRTRKGDTLFSFFHHVQ